MAGLLETICERAGTTLRDAGLLPGGAPVLVAVSGGCDSVVLLHALLELGYAVAVAHVDHGTREGASQQDATFVGSLAEGLGVPFHLTRHDVPAEARRRGVSLEQQGRTIRYGFFTTLARDRGYRAVATGHHADDQAETVLLRLLRGTGPEGLAGIKPLRMIDGVAVVRPLLGCRRAELAACAEAEGWVYHTDVSNADTRIPRNRIRHELLPRLTGDFNPAVVEALARLATMHQVQEDFMARHTGEAFAACVNDSEIDREGFRALHNALRHRVITHILQLRHIEHPCARVLELAHFVAQAATGNYIDVGGGYRFYAGRTHIILLQDEDGHGPNHSHPLAAPGETAALGHTFQIVLGAEVPGEPRAVCGPHCQVLDADRVAGTLHVRTRRPGDRFVPLGMTGSRKLKDYFIDRGVPAPARDAVPLVVDDAGIVWVVGHGPAARVCVDEDTTACIMISAAPLTLEKHHAPQ